MIALNIPLHLQKPQSKDCGPTSTLMILDYFGITSDAGEVIQKVPKCNYGTSSFDNAIAMMDYGLKVQMVLSQPLIFDGDFIRSNPSKQQIIAKIKAVKDKEKDPERKAIVDSLAAFIKADGQLLLKIPSKEIIIEALSNGKPVFASMFGSTLGQNQGGYHFVVIGGYENGRFLIYNPWQPSRQKSWEDADEVMFGIHCSTLFDYDNGTILIVDKQ